MLKFARASQNHKLLDAGYTGLLLDSFEDIEEGGAVPSALTVHFKT
jgi:hypothetical protein